MKLRERKRLLIKKVIKKYIFFVTACILFILQQVTFAQLIWNSWIETYGGSNEDRGWDIAQTNDSGFIISGFTNSFGIGNLSNIYLIRTNSTGDTLWTKSYGGLESDAGASVIQVSNGDFVVAGSSNSNICLLRTNSQGDNLWLKTYGKGQGYSVKETNDSGFIITGSIGGGNGVFLIRTNSIGDTIWTKSYIDIVGSGFRGSSLAITKDNGFIIIGYVQNPITYLDVYAIKTDLNGDTLWKRTYGGINNQYGFDVLQTDDEGFIILGTAEEPVGSKYFNNVYLIRIDADGDSLWSKKYKRYISDFGYSINNTNDNGYIITGSTQKDSTSAEMVLLMKIDRNGDTLWTNSFDIFYWSIGQSVLQVADNDYVIAGYASKEPNKSNPQCDVLLIRTDPNGNVVPIKQNTLPTPKLSNSLSISHDYTTNRISIDFSLLSSGQATISIYDIKGTLIKVLSDSNFSSGYHRVVWTPANSSGSGIGSGMYIFTVTTQQGFVSKKCTIIR